MTSNWRFYPRVFSLLLLLGVWWGAPQTVQAGEIEFVVKQDRSGIGTATVLLLEDPRSINPPPLNHYNAYTGIAALVYGREQFSDRAGQVWSYTVEYELLDQVNNVVKTGSLTLSHEDSKGQYESIGIHKGMSEKMRLQVTNVTATGPVPNDLRLELRMRVERYDELDNTFADTIAVKKGPAGHPDLKEHQAMICWPYVQGAESYEVEWAFWDSMNVQQAPNTTLVFAQSTTAETYNNYYVVDLVYPAGTVYFRVRAVGRYIDGAVNGNYTYRKYSTWSEAKQTPVGFEANYNWQFTRSFAEDGKHKAVINYFDDGLKSRQTLTTLSSEETTIIAEQLYDAESRPTLSILPVPVSHATQEDNPLQFGSDSDLAGRLLYHPSGNQVNYGRSNFDKSVGLSNRKADPLPSAHIASAYYSSQNPFLGTDQHIGSIPDAEGYPMAQVEYLDDGTGRVKRQSGVGDFYQIGTDRATEYFYANPTNTELRRMFGSNVGAAKHYRKNVVRDANGQLTTSYIDQAGQTIGTAMIGAIPENVQPLADSTKTYTESLMGSNVIDSLARTSIVQHQLFSDQDSNVHTFTYDLEKGVILSDGSSDFCTDCTYKVLFKIIDRDGRRVRLTWDAATIGRQPSYSDDTTLVFSYADTASTCTGPSYAPGGQVTFEATLDLGSYTVYKILRVTGPSLEELEAEARLSGLLISQDSFVRNFVRQNIDSTQCEPCSEAHRQELAAQYLELTEPDLSRGDSIFWAKVDSLLLVYTDCETLMDQVTLLTFYGQQLDCASMLGQMKRDLSPGGCLYEADFYRKAMLDPNYPHNDSFPLTLTDTAGVVHQRFTIGYMAILRDPGQWRPIWIDSLVRTHPEYERYTDCKYDSCHIKTRLFEYELSSYETWDEFFAVHDPSSVGQTPTDADVLNLINQVDPYFDCHAKGSKEAVRFGNILMSYCDTMSAYNTGVACPCSTASVLCYLDHNFTPAQLSASAPSNPNYVHPSPPSNTPALTPADFWAMFRGIYLTERKKIEYRRPTIVYPVSYRPGTCPQIAGEPTVGLAGGTTTGITDLYSVDSMVSALNSFNGDGDTLITAGGDTLINTSACNRICEANATQWMNQLCPDLQYDTTVVGGRIRGQIRQAFLDYCYSGCSNVGPPSPPNQNGLPNPLGMLLKEDLAAAMSGVDDIINSPNDPPNPTSLQQVAILYRDSVKGYLGYCAQIMDTLRNDTSISVSSTRVYCNVSAQTDPRLALVSPEKCQLMVDFFTALNSSTLFPTQWTATTGNPYVWTELYDASQVPNTAWGQVSGQLRRARFGISPSSDVGYLGIPGAQTGRIDSLIFNNVFQYSTPINANSAYLGVDRFIQFYGQFYDPGNPECGKDQFLGLGMEFWQADGTAINPFDIVGLVANSYNCNDNSLRLLVANPSCRWTGGGSVGTACNNPTTLEIQAFVRLRFDGSSCIPNWETSRDSTVRLCQSYTSTSFDPNLARIQCLQLQAQLLQNQAIGRYNQYRDSILNLLVNDSCIHVAEQLSVEKQQTEQHYTLYYYDEAGNLIQTIPPAGVNLLSEGDPQAFDLNGNWLGKEPEHDARHFTRYQYNTLGQVVEQVSPDGGKTVFWYDYAQRLRLSQSARYVVGGNYGVGGQYAYTQYDRKGRIIEVGRLDNYTVNPLDISSQDFPNNTTGTQRSEVIVTEYDELRFIPTGFTAAPLNQRGRVVRTYNDHIATYYDYDIHGNVKTLYHQIEDFGAAQIQYEYDLITGNVNEVRFMEGTSQEFRHRYWYDSDNRLTHTFTSQDGYIWERDARYFYYPHGPLMRCEKGEDNIQGEDYYYTLQGWIKGVNNTTTITDLGLDGNVDSLNSRHRWFGSDQMAYGLGYHAEDYNPIGSYNQGLMNPGTAFDGEIYGTGPIEGLYNGNISYMITHLPGLSNVSAAPTEAMVYQYDALHRIKRAVSFSTNGSGGWNPQWNSQSGQSSSYTYDPNGNLQTLNRNTNGQAIDQLSYVYDSNKPNRLLQIQDPQGSSGPDLDNQPTNNYNYDAIGNLIEDKSEQISQISWNFQNKITEVVYQSGANRPNVLYSYGPDGTRLSKTKVQSNGLKEQTLYIRDASGNILATYEVVNVKQFNPGEPPGNRPPIGAEYSRRLKETAIYGSSRLGMKQYPNALWQVYAPITTPSDSLSEGLVLENRVDWYSVSDRGGKYYEQSNHLGNVLAVVTDKKLYDITSLSYSAQVVSAIDYFPFGWSMPDRSFSADAYRFGFNGKENDREYGSQLVQDYGFRIYNPSIGKFLSVDPLTADYPSHTPYAFAMNRVIDGIDLDGLEWQPVNENGQNVDVGSDQTTDYKWVGYDKGYSQAGKLYRDRTDIPGFHGVLNPAAIKEADIPKTGTVGQAFIRRFSKDGVYQGKDVYGEDAYRTWYPAKDVAQMKVSDKGGQFIASYEGFRAKVYNANGWAIGYGQTVNPADWKDKSITQKAASQFLFQEADKDISEYLGIVKITRLTQHEFDALASAAYNFGPYGFAGKDLSKSFINQGINASNLSNTNDYFLNTLSLKMKKKYSGLVKRRSAEAQLFMFGFYKYKNNKHKDVKRSE